MTPGELPASPPDITAILTSLGVFSLAIAAVVGGIYKGIKEVKKESREGENLSGVNFVMDATTARQLTDSNTSLCESNREMITTLRALERRLDTVVEALGDHRGMVRSQIEEQHRLRAATVDLVELLRRR